VVYGTVAHNTVAKSSAKANGYYETPEWKRRLVKGEGSEQKDLFGPTGLENIFAKPANSPAKDVFTPVSKGKLGVLRGLPVIPSSPRGLPALPSSPPPWPIITNTDADRSASQSDSQVHHRQDSQQEPSVSDPEQSLSVAPQEPVRSVSGQIEFENEQFSPVFINTELEIGPSPEPPPQFRGSELANRLRQIGSPPDQRHAIQQGSSSNYTRGDSSFARIQDDSLPEGLPVGTPDIADVGRFVELRRGGYSREGSFRRRPLSPSPERASTGMSTRPSTRASTRASTQQGTGRSNDTVQTAVREPPIAASESAIADDEDYPRTPHAPRTPFRRLNQLNHLSHLQTPTPDRPKSSGSPLKLFGAHDTFTSNRLIRRLSQLEYKPDSNGPSAVQDGKSDFTRPVIHNRSRLASVEEVSGVHNNESKPDAQRPTPAPRRVSAFGHGQLNKYQFDADFTAASPDNRDTQEDSAPEDSPTSDVAPPGSRAPFKFHLDQPSSRESSRTTRQPSRQFSNPFRIVSQSGPQFKRHVPVVRVEIPPEDHEDHSDGKRGPTSPFKNPNPKRRRTINDPSDGDDDWESYDGGSRPTTGYSSRPRTQDSQYSSRPPTQDSHDAIQAVIGQIRQFSQETERARQFSQETERERHFSQGSEHEYSSYPADFDVMAQRHLLRPRNPTPSQRRREEIEAEIMEATEAFMQASPKLNTIREQLEPSMVSDESDEHDRAAAVANEVAMFTLKRQATRSHTRKRSVTTQDFLDEALKIMNFIRTKGRPANGLGDLEEMSELENMEDPSEQPSTTLTLERPPSREGQPSAWRNPNDKRKSDLSILTHLQKYEEKESDSYMTSSINSEKMSRIRGAAQREGFSEMSETGTVGRRARPFSLNRNDYDFNDARPQTGQSAGSSFGHTLATTFSRRSDQVATLAPEAVAHLIPQQIAGMSFNHEKRMWVRQKSPSKEYRLGGEEFINMTPSQSEEDPFNNIPDLSVSETGNNSAQVGTTTCLQPTAETLIESDEAEDEGRPMTCASSVPSKDSNNFGWSFTKTETRATSCSTQSPRKRSIQRVAPHQTTYAIPESDEGEIEHEIQYYEDRNPVTPHPRARVRDITISFAEREVGDIGRRRTEPPHHYGEPQRGLGIHDTSHTMNSAWSNPSGSSTLRRTRPSQKPRFNGDSELSVLKEQPSKNYRIGLSMNVSAPVLGRGNPDALLVAPSSSPMKGDVTFMLSELPEFTLNQVDEFDHPDRVVVKHDGNRYSKAREDRYAQGTAELVRAIQDIEPDEPYWEDLREISLRGKNLGSLHRLDELCYRLEELDVSDNQISQVEGIPYAMRRLQAHHNSLTGLTSWATLGNLQHLDVSNNDIDSLDGLAELVHLRVLKVDNNKLKTLDSILHLDGLMELHAGGNDIDLVDFARSNLKSLTDLDLRGNRLLEVRNVHRLSQLQHLNLGRY
jgi:hypothetical protein